MFPSWFLFSISFISTLIFIIFFPGISAGKESACNAGDSNSTPGSGRSAGERIGYPLQYSWASLVAQLIISLQCRRPGFDPWIVEIPWRRERLPTPVFCPGEFHGLYSPWGHKEPHSSSFHNSLQAVSPI